MAGGRAAPTLQERHAAQTGLAFSLLLGPIVALAALVLAPLILAPIILAPIILPTIVLAIVVLATFILATIVLPTIVLTTVILAIIRCVGLTAGTSIGTTGLRLVGLAVLLLRILLLAFLAFPAWSARNEAALALDHAEIVIGVLVIGLGLDAVAHGCGLAGQRLVLIVDLMRVAAHTDVRTAAVKNLIPVWRPVRIVIVLLLVLIVIAAAAAVTAAARTLTIVWSH